MNDPWTWTVERGLPKGGVVGWVEGGKREKLGQVYSINNFKNIKMRIKERVQKIEVKIE